MELNMLVEVLGYASLVLGVSSYLIKKQKTTRFMLGGAAGLMAGHLWLLGGITGALVQALLTVRSFASNYVHSKSERHLLFWGVGFFIIGFTIFTWDGPKSIIPALAALISTYALCFMNNKNMRKVLIFSSSLWLANGVVWSSIPQMATESIKLLINIYTIMNMTKNREFTTESALSMQDRKPLQMSEEELAFEKELQEKLDANKALQQSSPSL